MASAVYLGAEEPADFLMRFYSKLHYDPETDCHEWTRAVSLNGYGKFGVRKGFVICAHRLAWLLACGPVRDGLLICHRCDNRICCNPDHMFLGTHADNANDAAQKGRLRGRVGGGGKVQLTAEQVRLIRAMLAEGLSYRYIGECFGVTGSAIYMIASGRTWAKHN